MPVMAEGDATSGLGFDDQALGFMGSGPISLNQLSGPSTLPNDDVSGTFLGTTASWDFDGLQNTSYDLGPNDTSLASVQAQYASPGWQPSNNNQRPQPASSNSDGFEFSNVNPASLFSSAPENAVRGSAVPLSNLSVRPATTLTPALQEKLRNIAMPPHLHYGSPKSASSPESAKTAAASSPDASSTSHKDSRKRKVSDELDDDDLVEEGGKPVKKTAHNMIEKRYRTNINDKIAALRDSVPSLRIMSKSARGEDTTEDREELHGLTPAHKLNKATVLSKATEYIRHLEKRNNRLMEENGAMQARIAAFEKLFLAGAMNGAMPPMQPPTPMQMAQDCQQQQQPHLAPSPLETVQDANGMPAGMIDVPEDMKRIISAQMAVGQPYPVPPQYRYPPNQQHLVRTQEIQRQPQQGQQGVWSSASPYFGKLMVGSLAGLMIMEAVRENESSNEEPQGRGLFAIPLQMIGLIPRDMHIHLMGHHIHLSLKFMLLLGVVLWIFIPSLFSASENKSKKQQAADLQSAPSLASPIDIRQRAWATSIQTVWVPRHNFFLEAAALMLKTLKLSLRNVFGPHAYQVLTGVTPEQEAARIKAWSIALDSQLAGGDTEICMSRLVLTLLASGTLPDTPIRLMLKAIHVRVLLWDISQNSWQFGVIDAVAAKIARVQWNAARQLNQLLRQGKQQDDVLPDHLALLVEQECDDVLSPAVIQRAHNLAFNMPTTHNVLFPIDGMDVVVEDTSIGSPVDAVAAWWSTELLCEILSSTLDKDEDFICHRAELIELALRIAPIGSHAQSRAMSARAVLLDESRDENITAMREAIQTNGSEGPLPNSIYVPSPRSSSQASRFELEICLQCATLLSELKSSDDDQNSNPEAYSGRVEAILMLFTARLDSPMSLLSFTAIMEVTEELLKIKDTSVIYPPLVEKVAGILRLWVGGEPGSECGLNSDVQLKVIDRCLKIVKNMAGIDVDTGYGSMSDDEEEEDC